MIQELTSPRLWHWLGLATVALTSLGHAASISDTQPAWQLAPNTWLEPVALDGLPHEGTLGVRGDHDYFRIDVTEPTLTSIYTGGDVDTLGVLFDADGREMMRDDGSGQRGNFRIETLLPRRGTYYLMVRAGEGFFGVPLFYAFTGNYLLHAERVRESPTALPLDGPSEEGAISTGGEVDFFRLDVTQPTLAAIHTSGDFDTQGVLLDPDGRVVERDDDGGDGLNFRIETLLPRRGTYYLKVAHSYSTTRTGSYNIHAQRLGALTELRLDSPPQEGSISTDDEVDWYRLDVSGPTVAAIYTSADLDTEGILLDPDGRVIAEDDDGGDGLNFRIETPLARRGTYYLKVAPFSSTATGSYNIHAQRLGAPTELRLYGPPQEGSISTGGEVDWYRLNVSGPTPAAIYTSGGFDSAGLLFDPDGRAIAGRDDGGDGDNFRIETLLPRQGTYYLKVAHSYSTTRTGSYNIHAQRLGPAIPLQMDGPSPQEGSILRYGEEDFFWLDVTEPIQVSIYTSGGVDTGSELYDPDGELIAWDDDSGEGNNFRIDTVLLRSGTHMLKILSSHPGSTGSYTVHAAGSVGGSVTPSQPNTPGNGGGADPTTSGFDLDPANSDPLGIAFGLGRFYVVDYNDDRIYVYDASGQRVPAAEFDLNVPFAFGTGITFTFAAGRLHVVDTVGDRVLTYSASGQRVPTADFDLDPNNDNPEGITFGNGRFHVIDENRRVFAYDTTGQRVPSAEFDVDLENSHATGIVFANDRLYVVDRSDDKVYAYGASGQRVPAAEFDLDSDNYAPRGITFANGRFYVVDSIAERVFAY